MKPEEALRILEQATGQLSANRETHATIIRAIETIRATLNPKPEEPKLGTRARGTRVRG